MNWNKHIALNLAFLKSTLLISITVGMVLALYEQFSLLTGSFEDFVSRCLLFFSVGLIVDLVYKELSAKEEYYFYYNRGISKSELWIVSFLLYISLFLAFNLICYIWIAA